MVATTVRATRSATICRSAVATGGLVALTMAEKARRVAVDAVGQTTPAAPGGGDVLLGGSGGPDMESMLLRLNAKSLQRW